HMMSEVLFALVSRRKVTAACVPRCCTSTVTPGLCRSNPALKAADSSFGKEVKTESFLVSCARAGIENTTGARQDPIRNSRRFMIPLPILNLYFLSFWQFSIPILDWAVQ